jgi:hypothetical protein
MKVYWHKRIFAIALSFMMQVELYTHSSPIDSYETVTIAILAKDKAHTLPRYLACIERQTWPARRTYLYVRTNNNKDATAQILRQWVERVRDRYIKVYFDDTDIPEQVQRYGHHEWNEERLKALGRLRQQSIDWAYQHGSHYFVADCDNFIAPHTIEALAKTRLPIVAPLLKTADTFYSNYHAAIDENGYYADSPLYLSLWNQELKGLFEVPVVHCTYLVRREVLPDMIYDDGSGRFEYVIFSDNARLLRIPQYLDTRELYGRITFTETEAEFAAEPWIEEFPLENR